MAVLRGGGSGCSVVEKSRVGSRGGSEMRICELSGVPIFGSSQSPRPHIACD